MTNLKCTRSIILLGSCSCGGGKKIRCRKCILNSFFGQQIHTYNRNEYFDNAIFLILSWGIKFSSNIRSLVLRYYSADCQQNFEWIHTSGQISPQKVINGPHCHFSSINIFKKMITISAGRHSDHFTNMKKSIRPRRVLPSLLCMMKKRQLL